MCGHERFKRLDGVLEVGAAVRRGEDGVLGALLVRLLGDKAAIATPGAATLASLAANVRAAQAQSEKSFLQSALMKALRQLQEVRSDVPLPAAARSCIKILVNVTTAAADAQRFIWRVI